MQSGMTIGDKNPIRHNTFTKPWKSHNCKQLLTMQEWKRDIYICMCVVCVGVLSYLSPEWTYHTFKYVMSMK